MSFKNISSNKSIWRNIKAMHEMPTDSNNQYLKSFFFFWWMQWFDVVCGNIWIPLTNIRNEKWGKCTYFIPALYLFRTKTDSGVKTFLWLIISSLIREAKTRYLYKRELMMHLSPLRLQNHCRWWLQPWN